ncbi:MAG: DUF2807 domain-containing protein [Bacteroidales bacterium]|nr:DUF2807 domain-containing protein [Bacteroidales bacterium]
MKRILILTLSIPLIITSCIPLFTCIRGNGNMITEIRDPAAFDFLINSTAIDVVFAEADTFGIILEIEENLAGYIQTDVSGNRLEIKNSRGVNCINFTRTPLIRVSAPLLTGLVLSGSGNLDADLIEAENAVVKLTGSGNLVLESIVAISADITLSGSGDLSVRTIECNEADVKITGSGDFSAGGSADNGMFMLTGSGDSYTRNLITERATATLTGSGNLHIWVTMQLNAILSGSGNIYLGGQPQVYANISGSGRIIEFK